ncbi:phage tail spike protein [Lactococcus sp. S47]|uniref:phage tail spike protein n=1 Tax=Lactococcus sp. S47 TaxID=2767460 RepID=UPI001904A578|nr:phage tail spike protein [Lactococcus sp. S47]MBK0029255.1 phage tail protein [Lactococcus sp. S47]
MSIMILHDKTNNNWNSQGLGPLSEAMNPQVTRERNGAYELNFSYPVKGVLFKELLMGRWIVADAGPSQTAKAQRFEIAEITKPKNGIVTVYCEHYRYQLLRSIVKIGPKIENVSAQTVLNQLLVQMEPKSDFGFTSDIVTKSSIDFTDPSKFSNAQEVLGGVQGSILDNFGGEYLFDNNRVKLLSNAGVERNVIIAYGKNLTDISQEESIESTYTSVYGWAKLDEEDGQIITLPETYLDSDYVDNYTQRRIKMVDFSQDKPANTTDLRNLVTKYIKNNKVGIPKVNIKTSYVDLASSVMDAQLTNLEEIDLCDWVTVLFNQLDINTSAQIIKTVWNVALDKFDSLELGEASTNMSKVISDSQPDLNNITDKIGWLDDAQKEASDILNNPGKGNVVIYPSLADPQEILIMDTKDVNTAKNVWKWNAGGLGFSSTGYKGTYGLAMTNNGAIVADRMTTGTLRALDIIGVSISGSDITGTNIISGLIKGAQFVQNDNTGSAILGMKYGKLGFFNSESAAIEGNNAFASVYGDSNGGGTLLMHAGSTYLRIYGNGGSNFGGPLEIFGKITGDKGADLYGTLDMHGYSIINQSDIRLKENITKPTISGITETKRIQMAEFDFKQYYDNQNPKQQRPSVRQFGLIAQSTPFLAEIADESENHYLSVDLNRQVNLNTLTNQELIEKVEHLESRLIIKQKGNRKAYSRKGKRCRTKH